MLETVRAERQSGMNDAERAYWQGYARDLADRMGLRDWVVQIGRSPADDGMDGECRCTYGRRSIAIWLSADFERRTPEDQRWTVTHELCHAIANPVRWLVHANFENESKERHQLFYSLHKEALEQSIDHFALVIAETMPLPPKRKKGKKRWA
jgi:hypothetical protein